MTASASIRKIRRKIFERFYMTEPSRNSRSGGQGLGLAIVKSIIKKHNGTVRVASDIGKGATFTVTIPLDQKRYEREILRT
jgi:two-component system sensor histidine kinase BaeS